MISFKSVVCFLAFGIGLSVGKGIPPNDAQNRVVNGVPADITEFPFQIRLEASRRFFCSGSIVSEKHVLTAAHCTAEMNVNDIKVVAGVSRLDEKGMEYQVLSKSEHENYNPTPTKVDYDVCVLKIKERFTFSDKVQVITLAQANLNIADGTSMTVSGWGKTKYQGVLSWQLLKAVLPRANHEQCVEANKKVNIIVTRNMICAGGDIKGPCQGDSGGPLTMGSGSGRVLAGVVSHGHECAVPGYPGMFSSVPKFRGWIDSKMK